MFLIASGDLPKIRHRGVASKRCISFVEACTAGEDEDRMTAQELLLHPFLDLACDVSGMAKLLARTYELESGEDGSEETVNEDEEADAQEPQSPMSLTQPPQQLAVVEEETGLTSQEIMLSVEAPPEVNTTQPPTVQYGDKMSLSEDEDSEDDIVISVATKMTARPTMGRNLPSSPAIVPATRP